MILVIGGNAQGKKAFAEQKLVTAGQDPEIVWKSGASEDWNGFMSSRYCCEFHQFVRRLMNGEILFQGTSRWRPADETQQEEMIRLLKAVPGRILVTDEIGYGIVPLDAFERQYREETGRLCCIAARHSEQVWRVLCGIGQQIK